MPPIAFAAFTSSTRPGASSFPIPGTSAAPACSSVSAFSALATTSSGFAWSEGRHDAESSLQETLAHFRAVAESVPVPVNGDFRDGFATEPEGVGTNVALAVRTGLAGISIEDSTGDPSSPLFDVPLAVGRIRAARGAIDASGTGVLLTGRSEGFIAGRPDLGETIRRLLAYAEAGAECLYAPGIRTREDALAVVKAVGSPSPERPRSRRFHDRGGHGRCRSSTNQCRWGAGPRGVDGLSRGGEGDRRARHLLELRPQRLGTGDGEARRGMIDPPNRRG